MKKKPATIKKTPITTLFIDIGGVLLTNGWDKGSRRLAAETFKLEFNEMEERHKQTFDTYESGKIDLKEYLHRTVFYRKRTFTEAQFRKFMFAQSQPYLDMLALIRQLKARYQLKIAVVSNEAREINAYRIERFKLRDFVDFFISSCYVYYRKPDTDIYRLALEIAQTPIEQVLYIEDRALFVSVAENYGIKSIHHLDYQSTFDKLAEFGLKGDLA